MCTAFTPEPQKLVGRGQCRWLGLAGDLWVAMDPSSTQTLPRPHSPLFSNGWSPARGLAVLLCDPGLRVTGGRDSLVDRGFSLPRRSYPSLAARKAQSRRGGGTQTLCPSQGPSSPGCPALSGFLVGN